jgi:hypothetical protein
VNLSCQDIRALPHSEGPALAGRLSAWHVGALMIGKADGRYITLQGFFARQAGQ